MQITAKDLAPIQASIKTLSKRADGLGKDVLALQDQVDAAILKANTTIASIPTAPPGYPALFYSDDFVAADYPGGFLAQATGKWSFTLPPAVAANPYNTAQPFATDVFSLVAGPNAESLLRITALKTPLKSGVIASKPALIMKLSTSPFWIEAKMKHAADLGIEPIFGIMDMLGNAQNEILWIGSGAAAWTDGRVDVTPRQFEMLQIYAGGSPLGFEFFKSGARTFTGNTTDTAPNVVAGIPSISDGTTTFYVLSIEWTGSKFVGYYNRQRVWEFDLNGVNDPANQKSNITSIPRDDGAGMTIVLGLFLNGAASGFQEYLGNIGNAAVSSWTLDVDYVAVWKPDKVLQVPTVADVSFTTPTNVALIAPAPGALTKDQDPNGGALSVTRWDAASVGGFVISATGADGHFTYTPTGGFTGSDSFTYDAESSLFKGHPNTGTVRVGVNSILGPDPLLGTQITTPKGNVYSLKAHDEFHGSPPTTPHTGVPLYYDQKAWIPTFPNGADRTLLGNGESQYYFDIDYSGQDGRAWNSVANRNSDNGSLGSPSAPKSPGMYNPFVFTPDPAGILQLTAGPIAGGDLTNYWAGPGRPYQSGILCSHPDIHASARPFDKNADGVTLVNGGWRFATPYYIELRCKLPRNFGAWPAFWILTGGTPDNYTFTATKEDFWGRVIELNNNHWYDWSTTQGEIDFFEFFGHRPTKHSYGTVVATGQASTFQLLDTGVDLTLDYHKWGAEVRTDRTYLYLDDVIFADIPTASVFNLPNQHHLLINLAVGGNWFQQETGAAGPDAVDTSSFPWHFPLDYVRLYR